MNPRQKQFSLNRGASSKFLSVELLYVFFLFVLFCFSLNRYLFHTGDFEVFYAAAKRFLFSAEIHLGERNAYTYPTGSVLFLVPYSLLGVFAAKLLFFLTNFIFLVIGLRIAHRQILKGHRFHIWIVLLSALASVRFMASIFNNQQSDGIIFGLIMMGVDDFSRNKSRSSVLFAISAVLKANPLYMILVPILRKRIKLTLIFLVSFGILLILPDVCKYLLTPETQMTEIVLPARLIDRKNINQNKIFVVTPLHVEPLSYIREYFEFSFNRNNKWWDNTSNSLNQSLTRAVRYNLYAWSANGVLLGLCVFFGLALLALAPRLKNHIFMYGVLTYMAFVLIGPVSSKPHFVPLYVLSLFCWQDVFQRFHVLKAAVLLFCCAGIGLTSAGIVGNWAYVVAEKGHIAVLTLVIWIYTYILIWKKESVGMPASQAQTEPRSVQKANSYQFFHRA